MAMLFLWIVLAILAIVLCGFLAFIRTFSIESRLKRVEAELRLLAQRVGHPPTAPAQERPAPPLTPEKDASLAAAHGAAPKTPGYIARARQAAGPAGAVRSQAAPGPRLSEKLGKLTGTLSWEMLAGTKGLLWVGVLFVIVGVAHFLNYLYSLGFIDEHVRLLIAVVGGMLALGLAVWFRKKGWEVISQGFSGLGIAIFYVCVYFSFHIYAFTGQAVSFTLAVAVTILAVALAVVQHAPSIAVLAILGGFLSPILISTGENHPYSLFNYILLLNVIAVGVAWFKRWRFLDALCFVGTALLYSAWYLKFFGRYDEPDLTVPATLYAAIFYVLFFGVSCIYPLARRVKSRPQDLVLAAANAVFWFFSFYNVLYAHHRYMLGAIVLGQALLALLALLAWRKRVAGDAAAQGVLLVLAMGLAILAAPILLRLYAYQITWAVQGFVFVYLALKYRHVLAAGSGITAWTLGGLTLYLTLPLHTVRFVPVFNTAFGSWACVIAAGAAIALLLNRSAEQAAFWRVPATAYIGLSTGALACYLLTAELAQFWSTRGYANYRVHQHSSLALLWAVLPLGVLLFLCAMRLYRWLAAAILCYGAALVVWFAGLTHYPLATAWFLLNTSFLARLALPLSFWVSANRIRKTSRPLSNLFIVAGHLVFAVLAAVELEHWTHRTELVSDKVTLSFISSAWGLQAFCLIVIGMVWRSRTQRVLGLTFFAVTAAKVWLVDLDAVEPLYRILSFIAVGLLLLPASVLYQRFSDRLSGEHAASQAADAGNTEAS
ncbi:MAG: DUF2339 domain-containing protein [Candidatus Hydrogenedentales bacterium]|jgi:uncharacterized membrane protein